MFCIVIVAVFSLWFFSGNYSSRVMVKIGDGLGFPVVLFFQIPVMLSQEPNSGSQQDFRKGKLESSPSRGCGFLLGFPQGVAAKNLPPESVPSLGHPTVGGILLTCPQLCHNPPPKSQQPAEKSQCAVRNQRFELCSLRNQNWCDRNGNGDPHFRKCL